MQTRYKDYVLEGKCAAGDKVDEGKAEERLERLRQLGGTAAEFESSPAGEAAAAAEVQGVQGREGEDVGPLPSMASLTATLSASDQGGDTLIMSDREPEGAGAASPEVGGALVDGLCVWQVARLGPAATVLPLGAGVRPSRKGTSLPLPCPALPCMHRLKGLLRRRNCGPPPPHMGPHRRSASQWRPPSWPKPRSTPQRMVPAVQARRGCG